MLTGKRCQKLLLTMVMEPILMVRVCKWMMKNKTDVRNIYKALNKRSARLTSNEDLPVAIRCQNKNRGSEISAVMASAVSSIRLVREGPICTMTTH